MARDELSNFLVCDHPGFTFLRTQEAKYSFSGFIPTNKQTDKQMRSRDWGGKSLPGWYARPQLHSSWSRWSRLGAPARYGHYLDWWGQEFKCVNWRQKLNQRCQWFLCHWLRHCCCEFFRPFKRRDNWQVDQENKKIRKTRTIPFPKDKNPLDQWRHGAVHLSSFPCLGVLARRVPAIPATSTNHERLFSTAGNVTTKKRSHLTCDNMEELVYLHEVWPQVRDWEAVKKMRLEWFFFESMKHITFNVFSGLLFVDSETASE